MSQQYPKSFVRVDDYLAGERDGELRHEYVQGRVYAMAGASDRHNRIALNIASRFNGDLVNDPFETFTQPEETVHFASIGLSLSVADIYRNVRWDADQP